MVVMRHKILEKYTKIVKCYGEANENVTPILKLALCNNNTLLIQRIIEFLT